ncbi:uncharacterized protein LOC107413195 [Ziziphus jujuba]|uniref:Ubiquitin thioesterase OTU n=2 Tax=Ziziphus jujuba TaxID=326968 RepID=A0A6P3ZCR1_ZIZJJ|nr:uncharacterized protein LOC107413195 [Ziziphus jujuba]KAH7537001.1 hypothetical protein FEM48_Zijuj03G0045600 [Ziziphus jujuba var. spinosa]
MLGVLCARPKPWILTSLSSFVHGSAGHHHHHHHSSSSRLLHAPIQSADFAGGYARLTRPRHHSSACQLGGAGGAAATAASIWHAILPAAGRRCDVRRPGVQFELKGEGSWNAAWDARPARWLHRPDSAWLLFGVCACLAPVVDLLDANSEPVVSDDKANVVVPDEVVESSSGYRVTGVAADGRCLFRAIAHVACLRNGKEAPDENRQRQLADELRAQVVDELLKRREESEWYIEGDFDAYIKRIQEPYVWGGEPELIMASHVLKTPISVFMRDRTGGLVNIAKYGEEYRKVEEDPINLLFYGYGHYDILETFPNQSCQKLN